MKSKIFEIRDAGTCISVIAIKTEGSCKEEECHFNRNGWSEDTVIVTHISDGVTSNYSPYDWCNRTMRDAHLYIEQNFEKLENFEVIDIQFILGETDIKKVSEII